MLGGLLYQYNIQQNLILLSSLYAAPSAAPEMFAADAGERQVVFSWSPPLVTQQNGVITSYTLSCSPSLPQSPFLSGSLTVTGFSPDTAYSCSVVATNSKGSGPPANITFTTQQDCENSFSFPSYVVKYMYLSADIFFQLRLSGLLSTCSESVVSVLLIGIGSSPVFKPVISTGQ